jgi:hypothetical protein
VNWTWETERGSERVSNSGQRSWDGWSEMRNRWRVGARVRRKDEGAGGILFAVDRDQLTQV